jgi:hypothetical protein
MMISWPRWAASTATSLRQRKRWRPLRLTSRHAVCLSCLNANISRQFEFLQNAWIANTKFSGVTGESDPLLGNRESIPGCPVTGNFTIPGDGTPRRRVSGLPQFVTVRGGAYFFLPSLRALRYFAGA